MLTLIQAGSYTSNGKTKPKRKREKCQVKGREVNQKKDSIYAMTSAGIIK